MRKQGDSKLWNPPVDNNGLRYIGQKIWHIRDRNLRIVIALTERFGIEKEFNNGNYSDINFEQIKAAVLERYKENRDKIKAEYTSEILNAELENPYLALCVYCRNEYVAKFTDMGYWFYNDKLDKYKNFDLPVEERGEYSLRDLAANYSAMEGKYDKKSIEGSYKNIQHCLKETPFFAKHKIPAGYDGDGFAKYFFYDITSPLAAYIYFRSKNKNQDKRKVKRETDAEATDKFIMCKCVPFLRLRILETKKRIGDFPEYISYIWSLFDEIFEIEPSNKSSKLQCLMLDALCRAFDSARDWVEGKIWSDMNSSDIREIYRDVIKNFENLVNEPD